MKWLTTAALDHTPEALVCASTDAIFAALVPGTIVLNADSLDPSVLATRMDGVVFTFASRPSDRWLAVARGKRCVLAAPDGPTYRWYPPIAVQPPRTLLERAWLSVRDPSDRELVMKSTAGVTWTTDSHDADVIIDLASDSVLPRTYLNVLARGALVLADRPFAAELAIEENEDFARVDDTKHAIRVLNTALASPRSVLGMRVRGRQKIDEVFSPRRAYALLVSDSSRLLRAASPA